MQEILIKTLPDGKLWRHQDGQVRSRTERIAFQLAEARKLANVQIFLKKGRKLRLIRTNTVLTQKSLFK